MYWIKYYRNGKPFSESSRSDKKVVAERLLKKREGEIGQGKLPGIYYDRVKFDELAEDFLTDYRINKKRTLKRAERCVRYLLKEFGGMKAVEVNTSRIKKYIDKRLEDGVSNATINRELSAIKRMFSLGVKCTPPTVEKVPYMPMLKENNVRKGFVEQEDFLALRDALPAYLKPIVSLAYYSGWRRSEILGLKWNQVNLRDGIIRLEPGETKNDEGRTLYMPSELLTIMRKHHQNRRLDCLYVFHHKGRQISDFRGSWNKACKAVGLQGLLFHDLRRSGVRNMIRAGVPERVAMTISGHKTRSVFDRYNIVSQEDLKEAATRLHQFNEEQETQLQNSYNHPHQQKRVTPIQAVTP